MAMSVDQFQEVGEAAFIAFLVAYPRPLGRSAHHVYHPPLETYNDFTRAPYWPDSVVAYRPVGHEGGWVLADIDAPVRDDGARQTDQPTLDANGVDLRVGDRVRVLWGSSSEPNTTSFGRTYDESGQCFEEHTVTLNDPGTEYERLGISGCANRIHSQSTWKIG